MRTGCSEADNVPIGADAFRNALSEFEQHARRVIVWIVNIKRLIQLEK